MHIIHEKLSKLEKIKPIKCSNKINCEYFRFPNNLCACILSDVFSVNQGEDCCTYKIKGIINEFK